MFKKTLMAAALAAATGSAFAGTITVSGDAFKVGNEYLGAYTGSALSGDVEAAGNYIAYNAGIALGVNNTLKFVFSGGAIAADTGLKLQVNEANVAAYAGSAGILADIATAVAAVADATADTDAALAIELANAQAAAYEVIDAAEAADITADASGLRAAIAALGPFTGAGDDPGDAKAAVDAVAVAVSTFDIEDIADLVDFGVDANGDYEWVLFKLTGATTVDQTLYFNDIDDDSAANITTKFTKATIGSGDLTIAMPEAKDDTGANLSAPVAAAKTLVTTANQFSVTATTVTDTIDVDQDRLFFVDTTAGQDTTGTFTFDITENSVGLGIDASTAEVLFTLEGSLTGVEAVTPVNATLVADTTNQFERASIDEANDSTFTIQVDGETNLATRTVTVSAMVTPSEANTDAFYLNGASASSNKNKAFVWDLNGSEITFPYAPIGYSHITTNFELANSGSQEGEVLVTAFGRDGAQYSGTLTQKATPNSLVKVSGADVYAALDLDAAASLSITFTTTAPDADIKMTGYSNLASGGRMALLSDAYEGESDKANCVLTGTAGADDLAITCN